MSKGVLRSCKERSEARKERGVREEGEGENCGAETTTRGTLEKS